MYGIDEDALVVCRRHSGPIVVATIAVMGVVAWRFGHSTALPAFLYLAAVGTVLAAVDMATLRLPDRLVLPSYVVAAASLGTATLGGAGSGADLVRALLGMAISFLGYLVLILMNPSGLGFGDVKLAGLLGLYLGWTGWQSLLWGNCAAFFLVALAGLALILLRRGNRKTDLPFGPFMIAATLLVVIL